MRLVGSNPTASAGNALMTCADAVDRHAWRRDRAAYALGFGCSLGCTFRLSGVLIVAQRTRQERVLSGMKRHRLDGTGLVGG